MLTNREVNEMMKGFQRIQNSERKIVREVQRGVRGREKREGCVQRTN